MRDCCCAGLPVPTQDIVEAVQAILGLLPPPKLAAAVQKLINCCPEARTALEEQALSSQDGRGSGACPSPRDMPWAIELGLLLPIYY